MSKDTIFPKISIITPSFNQAKYLEATILSVLNQGYPNLEYIVIDGGSTDRSLEILQKYSDRLAKWESKPDGGQYDAINKGFSHSTGEIMAWLNSDDIYFPWTLAIVAKLFASYPEIEWISGGECYMNDDGQVFETNVLGGGLSRKLIAKGIYRRGLAGFLPQEGIFWRRTLWQKSGGGLDTKYKLAGDFDLWCRFAQYAEPIAINCLLSAFRIHPLEQRSTKFQTEYENEVDQIASQLSKNVILNYFGKTIGRMKVINIIFLLLGMWGSSNNIVYDRKLSKWILKKKIGPLFRMLVTKGKV